jgi:hypothetical protein
MRAWIAINGYQMTTTSTGELDSRPFCCAGDGLGLAATVLLTVVSTARPQNTAVDVSVSVLTALVFLAVLTRVGLVGAVSFTLVLRVL